MKIKHYLIASSSAAILFASALTFANTESFRAMGVNILSNQLNDKLQMLAGSSSGIVMSSGMCTHNMCGATLIKASDTHIGDNATWKIGTDLSHYCNFYWEVNANSQIAFMREKSNCVGGFSIVKSSVTHDGNGVSFNGIVINHNQ